MHRYGDEVAAIARPLRDAGDLDILLDRAENARVVLIGEASHGTHEFYAWRATLTRRLIEECGYSFVAVEGDWPDCARVDAAVRGGPDPRAALLGYDRWPTWMWANEETVDFTRWLRAHNEGRDAHAKVGFHGLDVYSLWESLREILVWLREHDPEQVPVALAAYDCLSGYGEDPNAYAYAARMVESSCEDRVVRMLIELRGHDLAVWQNAEVVAGAEHYYRALVQGGSRSWNVRDRHMDATLARLLDHYGASGGPASGGSASGGSASGGPASGGSAKAVVWAHNTHVGDSRATDQSRHGEVTLGELARERFGADRVLIVGLGSHRGTVVAGPGWGAPMEVMGVPPGKPDSLEDILHIAAPPAALFVFPPLGGRPDLLVDEVPHRAIGVVYRPERERWGNYVPSVLGDRYDAFLWIDETHALLPLHPLHIDIREPETYPSGV